ncbi:hypothetical protein [Cyanothece sp. BG0011]|uniref:hypothetical protein n=1 Tax=Cyanothece sp. BG0011 TaxID=2082950 RepID=UPI0018E4FF09|nr:hypothetical protein [Cyanothece sp. BG0011]
MINNDPNTIKQLWSNIEQIQAHRILSLNNAELIDKLLSQFQDHKDLSFEEIKGLTHYIEQRIALIRDLAECRLEEQFA